MGEASAGVLDQLTELAATESGVFRCVGRVSFLSDDDGATIDGPDALLVSILEAHDAEDIAGLIEEASLATLRCRRHPQGFVLGDTSENVFHDPAALKEVFGDKSADLCLLVGAQIARLLPAILKQVSKHAQGAPGAGTKAQPDFCLRDFVYDPSTPRVVRKGVAGLFRTLSACTVILSAVRHGKRLESWRAEAIVSEFAAPVAAFLTFVAAPGAQERFRRLLHDDQERARKAKASLDQLYSLPR